MSLSVAIRPAPVRRAVTFTLEGTLLTAGERRVELAQVTAARFVDFGADKRPIRYLVLEHPEGALRIDCNAGGGLAAMDRDMQGFIDLAAAILDALAGAQPGLRVEIGERGAARWAMFGIGVVSLAVGIGLPLAALASGASGDRLLAAAVPSGILALVGIALALANAPGRDLPSLPPGALAEQVRAMRPGLPGA